MEEKDDELQTNFGATRCSIWELALVCRWGTWFFQGHESEDIRAII